MSKTLKGHLLLRHYYQKLGITQVSQINRVSSDKGQVSRAMSGKNEKVLFMLVRAFLEDHGEQEGVTWEDFFPPSQMSIEARMENIEQTQTELKSITRDMLDLLRSLEKKIE